MPYREPADRPDEDRVLHSSCTVLTRSVIVRYAGNEYLGKRSSGYDWTFTDAVGRYYDGDVRGLRKFIAEYDQTVEENERALEFAQLKEEAGL
jgi:hypothetical protein